MESYFSRKLPIEGNYGTVWRGPWGAGTFTEAEACLRCCLVSRSRLKSQTGHQVSKGRDSLQHLGPFKGSEYGKSVSTGSKQVKLYWPPWAGYFYLKSVHQTTLHASWPASGPDSSIFSPSHSYTTAMTNAIPLCHYCSCPIKCDVNQISIETS